MAIKEINPKLLHGEKVRLQLIDQSFCTQQYVDWLNDPKINRYLESRWVKHDLQSVKSYIEQMQSDPKNYQFVIIEKASNQHIGNIKLGPIDFNNQRCEMGYFIGNQGFWGKGLASEAIQVACTIGFEELNIFTIIAAVAGQNIASIKVLEKNGFIRVGIYKDALKVNQNQRDDHVFYYKQR